LSVNIWSPFRYGKLYDVATLSAESRRVFRGLGTTNFEVVLQALAQTRLALPDTTAAG
jgi:hypothetical protein